MYGREYKDKREYPKAWTDDARIERMNQTIRMAEEDYRSNRALEDFRNLAYWRGRFWKGDGAAASVILGGDGNPDYQAEQNEIYPMLTSLTNALALDCPQVNLMDQRVESGQVLGDDPAYAGRRQAAVLNHYAFHDDLKETTRRRVYSTALFPAGGMVKTTWDPDRGILRWRDKLPWQVLFDKDATRWDDMRWIVERFVMHIDDFRGYVDEGVYQKPQQGTIEPDAYPRTLLDLVAGLDSEQYTRRYGSLQEYVTVHEFWDLAQGCFYHFHVETNTVLACWPIPTARYDRWRRGNPYSQTSFAPWLTTPETLPVVSIVAKLQQDLNRMVSARRVMIDRMPGWMFYLATAFKDEDRLKAFLAGDLTTPVGVDGNMPIEEVVKFIQGASTSADFNRDLQGIIEHIRYSAGEANFRHGRVENIRTAEEANMILQATSNDIQAMSKEVAAKVTRDFENGRWLLRWAASNPDDTGFSGVATELWEDTQDGVAYEDWVSELANARGQFRVLPFSPVLEDINAQRTSITQLVPIILGSPALAQQFNPTELAREIQETYHWRRGVLAQQGQGALAPGMAPEGAAAQAEPGMPPGPSVNPPMMPNFPGLPGAGLGGVPGPSGV